MRTFTGTILAHFRVGVKHFIALVITYVFLLDFYGPDERRQQCLQGLPLSETDANEQAQTPQALGLSGPSPGSWVALKRDVELTLKRNNL